MIDLFFPTFSGMLRRTLLLSALLLAGLAQAQTGTIKLLVGFPPGGGTDAIARILAEKLKDQLGSPVIVENRAGAGGQIAAQALKVAPADGTTYFLSHDHTISILPLVVKSPGFDPAKDFVAVAGFATFVNALALSGGTPALRTASDTERTKASSQSSGSCSAQPGRGCRVGYPREASATRFPLRSKRQARRLWVPTSIPSR